MDFGEILQRFFIIFFCVIPTCQDKTSRWSRIFFKQCMLIILQKLNPCEEKQLLQPFQMRFCSFFRIRFHEKFIQSRIIIFFAFQFFWKRLPKGRNANYKQQQPFHLRSLVWKSNADNKILITLKTALTALAIMIWPWCFVMLLHPFHTDMNILSQVKLHVGFPDTGIIGFFLIFWFEVRIRNCLTVTFGIDFGNT